MPKKELSNAKKNKNDEFYTSYEDVQKEMNYYKEQFNGKTVLCNCDDPYESNFCKFFLKNFNYLKLKRLICTSYSGSAVIGTQHKLLDEEGKTVDSKHGYVIDVNTVPMKNGRGVSDDDIQELLNSKEYGVKRLKGDGDFASEECIEYLKCCDIVTTNCPFSKFREYLDLLMEHNKKFLIIGNQNAITYKEVFPLLKENKMWLGASIHSGDREFRVPDSYPLNSAGFRIDENGFKYIRVKGVRWFTNLDYAQRHEDLILYKRYSETEYPKYDNYDAINVDKTVEIPFDYNGVIGVPITFLDKYNPEQFEIIGLAPERLSENESSLQIKRYKNAIQHNMNGTTCSGNKVNDGPVLKLKDKPKKYPYYTCPLEKDYYLKVLYARILIKKKTI